MMPWVAECVNRDVVKLPPVVWQASHDLVVGIWLAGLPLAVEPWQLAQEPGITLTWVKDALIHVVVRWQVSQG